MFSRKVGQSFSIDESTFFRLIAVGNDEASLLRTDPAGLNADELILRASELRAIAPGVRATLILDGSGVARFGFEAEPAIQIRRIDGVSLTATKSFGRQKRI